MKKKPHQVSAGCSVGTADEKQDAGSPVKALHTHQPLDFIRAVISFTVTGDACHYHRTLRNAVVEGGWLNRRQDGGYPSQGVAAAKMAAVPVRKPSGRSVLREIILRQI